MNITPPPPPQQRQHQQQKISLFFGFSWADFCVGFYLFFFQPFNSAWSLIRNWNYKLWLRWWWLIKPHFGDILTLYCTVRFERPQCSHLAFYLFVVVCVSVREWNKSIGKSPSEKINVQLYYMEDPANKIIIIIFVWLKIDLIVFSLEENEWWTNSMTHCIRYTMFHILILGTWTVQQWMQPLTISQEFERHKNTHWYHHEIFVCMRSSHTAHEKSTCQMRK